MIKKIKLINFRNFADKKIEDLERENFIIAENGKGKTNILEAISLLSNNSITKLNFEDLVKMGENYFFIEIIDENDKSFSIYFSPEEKKKSFMINNKKTSSKSFFEQSYKSVVFSPSTMNMFYLSPSLRRDFLDYSLKSSFSEYDKLQKDYRKILKSRNNILKAINEGKAQKSEINFWDKEFILKASLIYKYRFKIIEFIQASIKNIEDCFLGKIQNIELNYISKVKKESVENDIKEYIEKNFERDLILQKTHIGPHLDDFEILVDQKNIIQFASRGEVKSVVIYLKLLEGLFIERNTKKRPIMIIDDLLSELDNFHKKLLLEKTKYYQSFISSINQIDSKKDSIIL